MRIAKRKTKFLPLPNGQPPGPPIWQEALARSRPTYPEGQPDLERWLDSHWEACLYWVAKLKWRSPVVIPRAKEFQLLKPQAEVLIAILNLCSELHTLGYGGQYRNAGQWWCDIAWEFQCAIRSDHYLATEFLVSKRRRWAIAQSLKKRKNPFCEDMKRLAHLVDCALGIAELAPAITEDLLIGSQRQPTKGLAAAFSAWQTAIERGGTTGIKIDEKSYRLLRKSKP